MFIYVTSAVVFKKAMFFLNEFTVSLNGLTYVVSEGPPKLPNGTEVTI